MDLRNKKVTVVGLGNSGLDSALLLYEQGAIVSVTDNSDNDDIRRKASFLEERYIDAEIGQHTEGFLSEIELLVVSPAVEGTSLPIGYAQENNIPIISELELGYLFCKAPIVAVTGTNGKSTVVSLLGEILRCAGIPVVVCGNIGNSFTGEVKNMGEDTVAVVEVSSFQLEWITSFRPRISVILNVTEDHMDRYRNFDDYLAAKNRIFENQKDTDITILNYDDRNLRGLARSQKMASKVLYFSAKKKIEGIYLDRDSINISFKSRIAPLRNEISGEVKKLFKGRDSKLVRPLGVSAGLKGKHNIENILASFLTATLFGVGTSSVEKAVEGFRPLKHRFESIATIGGIEFIDDSKATNIDSTYRALKSLDRPPILIAGGKDKNLSYKKVMPVVKNKVKKVILIGETKHKMRDIFKGFVPVEEKDSLEEAVQAAHKSASPGDCVLLSPMCSSFDMFRDYRYRGEVFRRAVESLKDKAKSEIRNPKFETNPKS